jgi:hypothetical protein
MARKKKYYDTKREALKVCESLNDPTVHVFKMPKGTRHAGKYAVCDEMEFLNTY